MYCKFQIFSNGEWVNFGRLTYPLNLGETLTADTSSAYSVTIYMNGSSELALESLTPGTLCRINFGSRIYSFVVIDGGRIAPRVGLSFCFHAYTIQEALCYAREIYVQSAFFSNGHYDVQQFFTRLFALSECDLEQVLSTNEAYDLLVENWQSPDYQVASNSMLDNLIKLGLNNQVRFKARINSEGQLEYYAKSLKGDTVLTSINGRKVGESTQYLGANYASRVVANVQNMASDQEFWYPEDDKTVGIFAEPDNDQPSTDSREKLVLVLPYNIKSASTVRVIGLFNKSILTNPYLKDSNGNLICETEPQLLEYLSTIPDVYNGVRFRNVTGVVLDVPVYEYAEWLLLDPDETDGATRHKMNTLYYKRGENKVYNIHVMYDYYDPDQIYFDYSPIYYTLGMQPIYQEMFPEHNFYVVKCSLYYDGVIKYSNRLNSVRTSHYSQEDNLVSGKALIANLKNHIESMRNEEEQLSYVFDSIDDLPESGSIFNGKVISTINFECTNKKITATMTLSDELVKKSEYLSADVGLDLPAIPVDKAFDRFTNYLSSIWFCRTSSDADDILTLKGSSPYLQDLFADYVLDCFENGRELQAKMPAEILLKTGEVEENPQYSALGLAIRVIHNSLFISWAARGPGFVGPMIDKRDSFDFDDFRYYNVSFVKEQGLSKELKYRVLPDSVRSIEPNFPAVSESTFEESSPLIAIDDINHYHDPAEVIKASIQINIECVNISDIASPLLYQESSLLKDTLNTADEYDRYIKVHLDDVIIQAVSISKVSDGKFKVELTSDELTATQDYYNVIIYRKHKVSNVEEDMLRIRALVRDNFGGSKSVVIYVAFTG